MNKQSSLLEVNNSGYQSDDNLVLAPWFTSELSDNVRPPWLVQVTNKKSDTTERSYGKTNIVTKYYTAVTPIN